MPITEITGDLLRDAPTSVGCYLAHQCNCITKRGKHLSGDMFRRFPTANIYSCRAIRGHRDTPGTCIVRGPVINLLGQYYPGRSRYGNDTPAMRLGWFKSAMEAIDMELLGLGEVRVISFPYGIGCGAAGGNWPDYYAVITKWATEHPEVDVRIYRLPNNRTDSNTSVSGSGAGSGASAGTGSGTSAGTGKLGKGVKSSG